MRTTLILIVAMVAPTLAEDSPLVAAQKDLEGLRIVTGQGWGFADSPGAFYGIAHTFVDLGREADLRKLLRHPDPIPRAMGLFSLVQVKGEAALPDLRAHLSDAGEFGFVPYGCTEEQVTVGTFAFCLILDRNYLHFRAPRQPLLAEPARVDQCVAVLVRDDCFHVRRYRGSNRKETWRTFTGLARLGRKKLVELLPGRSLAEIAKAVGRLPPDAASRSLLAGILNDPDADRESRLAAASGLTRASAGEAAHLIERHEAALNGKDASRPGSRLLAVARRLATEEEVDEPLHPGRFAGVERILVEEWFDQYPTEERRKESLARVEDLIARLGRFAEPWDTWSDTVYRIRRLVDRVDVPRPGEGPVKPLLSEAEKEDLRRRIRPHLK